MGNIVKIGAVGAQRNYTLKQVGEGIAWDRANANPFAARVDTSSIYNSVDAWNEYVQENWQAGVGRVNPEEGGFLYGEVDSRVPNQLILPQAISHLGGAAGGEGTVYNYWSMTPGQDETGASVINATRGSYSLATNNYLAWRVGTVWEFVDGEYDLTTLWVYGECADGTVLRADLYASSDNTASENDQGGIFVNDDPGSSLANASVTITNDFPGPQWHKIGLAASDLVEDRDYFLVLRPTTGSIVLHGVTNLSPAMSVRTSTNGSAWSNLTTFQPFFVANTAPSDEEGHHSQTLLDSIIKITYSTHEQGVAIVGRSLPSDDGRVWVHAAWKNQPFIENAARSDKGDEPTDAAVFLNRLYVARGSGDNMSYIALDLGGSGLDDMTEDSVAADLLLSFGGYLWRTIGNDLYYSGNASAWTTVGQVCGDPWEIRSMAGLAGDLYLACDDGLYRCAPGDFIEGIAPWQPHELNGRSMCSHNGALYIVVNGRILRYDQSGQMRDVWVSRDDDLPATRLGEVVSVTATDLWVAALVTSTTGRCSVWVYQDEGWHQIATLPSTAAHTMYYERATHKLWIGTSDGNVFRVYMPTNALNPYNDSASRYMPAGWIQQDKFYGGQYLLNKDFESVTIVGDNLSSGVNVKVYWQDEGSTAWELLGTATSDGQELRWSNHSTRPQGKWVKLGLLLNTNTAGKTPRVRAIITKFQPMVNDRIRDSITLTLKSFIQMPDGAPDQYTLAQQLTHVNSMIDRVIPFIYTDPLNVSYEAKVISSGQRITRFGYENGANVIKEMEVTLVVEQIPDAVYVAPPP